MLRTDIVDLWFGGFCAGTDEGEGGLNPALCVPSSVWREDSSKSSSALPDFVFGISNGSSTCGGMYRNKDGAKITEKFYFCGLCSI